MSEYVNNPNNHNFMDIENQVFFYFDSDDFSDKINAFCDELRIHNIGGANNSIETVDYLSPLKRIMRSITPPYTVILEHYYVDKSYRDSYYRYFSSGHFNAERSSRRLSFFQGEVSEEKFLNFKIPCVSIQDAQKEEFENKEKLIYYGSIVINPVMTGAIGRTILDPRCLNLQKKGSNSVYMRLSKFKTHIYGRSLKVSAFPYRMQDGETVSCAEVTFLNLLDYYSNHYPDYKSALPGEILDEEMRHSHERVLPSKGMSYAVMSKLMSSFGFSPRLYSRFSVDSFSGSLISPEIKLKRWMYYYIESGIPVAVELGTDRPKGSGHSVICIGHGGIDNNTLREKIRYAHKIGHKTDNNRVFLNSADFYDSYVIVDDNIPVYNIKDYTELSQYKDLKVASLAVPLNRRMCLDAPDAEDTVLTILNDSRLGLDRWIKKGYLKKNEAIIMRLYLASSHSFKGYRIRTFKNEDLKALYAYTPMPRFVWVCELYKFDEYFDLAGGKIKDTVKAFGEIVLDTTAVPTKEYSPKAIVLAHYPGYLLTLFPEDTYTGFNEMFEIDNDEPFPGFKNNLAEIT